MTKESTGEPGDGPAVIGVLGGIASGKSRAARFLAGSGGVVLDADAIARELLGEAQSAAWLGEALGPGVLDEGGRPDRQALARLVFSSPGAREKLEGWIHPRIRERIRAGLERARAQGRGPIVLDVPLLLEHEAAHGLAGECDFLVFIETPVEDRERRAQERRGWPAGEVSRRERVQMPLAEKRTHARHIISNRAGLEELEQNVNEILLLEQLPH